MNNLPPNVSAEGLQFYLDCVRPNIPTNQEAVDHYNKQFFNGRSMSLPLQPSNERPETLGISVEYSHLKVERVDTVVARVIDPLLFHYIEVCFTATPATPGKGGVGSPHKGWAYFQLFYSFNDHLHVNLVAASPQRKFTNEPRSEIAGGNVVVDYSPPLPITINGGEMHPTVDEMVRDLRESESFISINYGDFGYTLLHAMFPPPYDDFYYPYLRNALSRYEYNFDRPLGGAPPYEIFLATLKYEAAQQEPGPKEYEAAYDAAVAEGEAAHEETFRRYRGGERAACEETYDAYTAAYNASITGWSAAWKEDIKMNYIEKRRGTRQTLVSKETGE